MAIASQSVGVLSEALHSGLDLVSAAVSYFTVRAAVKPADDDHPFGHGKIETLSALFEAILLSAAAIWIVVEALAHFREPHEVAYQGLAMATIFISMVLSYFVYRHNLSAAEETDSSALHVNALHFLSDVVASAGVLGGLILLKITGLNIIDPIIAFAVAGYIFAISLKQVLKGLGELTDTSLPLSEIEQIKTVLGEFKSERVVEVHDLRTRKSGSMRHIDFHLGVCAHLTVRQSHDICDEIEGRLMKEFPQSSVTIHVEPCEVEHVGCAGECPYFPDKKGGASS